MQDIQYNEYSASNTTVYEIKLTLLTYLSPSHYHHYDKKKNI